MDNLFDIIFNFISDIVKKYDDKRDEKIKNKNKLNIENNKNKQENTNNIKNQDADKSPKIPPKNEENNLNDKLPEQQEKQQNTPNQNTKNTPENTTTKTENTNTTTNTSTTTTNTKQETTTTAKQTTKLQIQNTNTTTPTQKETTKHEETIMKINTDHKSPNCSSRNGTTIDTIIIHHTGGNDCSKTLKWFSMKDSSVSAHYVIDRDGTVYAVVDEDKSAWHAGTSWLPQEHDKNWNKGSVNPRSIGIELVNLGDGKTEFPQKQMESLKQLVSTLKTKYNIDNAHILGHKEVAPGRKTDPADNFDWGEIR